MASRIPGAVGALRRHLQANIPDETDRRVAEQRILDLLEAFSGSGGGGEAEDRAARDFMIASTSSLARSTGDYRRPGMGLDRLTFDGRAAPKRTSAGLAELLKGASAPGRPETVR